jgi:hypothetical protein
VPLVWYSLYFLALHLTHGVWWSVHVWAGAIVVAGLVGWLVSYLVVPRRCRRRRTAAEWSRGPPHRCLRWGGSIS